MASLPGRGRSADPQGSGNPYVKAFKERRYPTIVIAAETLGHCASIRFSTVMRPAVQWRSVPSSALMTSGIVIHEGHPGRLAEGDAKLGQTLRRSTKSHRVTLPKKTLRVVYANGQMLGYSSQMDWRPVIVADATQGAGLGILLPTLTKTAFSMLDPTFRPKGTMVFNMSRLYGSASGIALVITLFYNNTQAMHVALAKVLAPYRATAQCYRFDRPARAGHAQRPDHRPSGFHRDHRPVRAHNGSNVDRKPACTFLLEPHPANQPGA